LNVITILPKTRHLYRIISGSDFVMFFTSKLPFLSNSPCLRAKSLCSCSKRFVCTQIHCCLQKCPVFQFKLLSSHSSSRTSARSHFLSLSLALSLTHTHSLSHSHIWIH